jgi:hypothetical protein
MVHIPAGGLRSCNSAFLPFCHMLFLYGVYTTTHRAINHFHRTHAPNQQELAELVQTISHRVAGFPERGGILERDKEKSYLNLEASLIRLSVSRSRGAAKSRKRRIFSGMRPRDAWIRCTGTGSGS